MTKAEKVKVFMQAMGHETPTRIALPSVQQQSLGFKLISEELTELQAAYSEGDLTAVADALLDILYTTYWNFVRCGFTSDQIEFLFDQVHKNNMTKMGPDGKAIYDENGKVMKPKGFVPLNLEPYIKAMVATGEAALPVQAMERAQQANRDPELWYSDSEYWSKIKIQENWDQSKFRPTAIDPEKVAQSHKEMEEKTKIEELPIKGQVMDIPLFLGTVNKVTLPKGYKILAFIPGNELSRSNVMYVVMYVEALENRRTDKEELHFSIFKTWETIALRDKGFDQSYMASVRLPNSEVVHIYQVKPH